MWPLRYFPVRFFNARYWVKSGSSPNPLPGILQSAATLISPVGYEAALLQPVGYGAVEII